jgi:CRISPR/Cas system-associated exonuclease Cas4 (RecB family)
MMAAVQSSSAEQFPLFELSARSPSWSDPNSVLSPTQVRTFMNCQVRWYFKYVEDRPDPQTSSLALGKAVHSAVAENFAQKIESKEDLPVTGVLALYRDAWHEESRRTMFRGDEDAAAIGRVGEDLVAKYIDEAAPKIEPAAVGLPVAGEIGGVKVRGVVDLIDIEGRIIDLKTRGRRPSEVASDTAFQIATYRQLVPGASGSARIDTLIKTKTVQLVQQSYEVNERDLRATRVLYPLFREAMNSGLYMPNRLSTLCSRRNCPYWRNCEDEFGGKVGEV